MNSVDMHIVDRKIDLLKRDLAQSLNQMAEALIGITEAHRAFQVYVDENLQELREAAGLGRKDTAIPEVSKEGKEL